MYVFSSYVYFLDVCDVFRNGRTISVVWNCMKKNQWEVTRIRSLKTRPRDSVRIQQKRWADQWLQWIIYHPDLATQLERNSVRFQGKRWADHQRSVYFFQWAEQEKSVRRPEISVRPINIPQKIVPKKTNTIKLQMKKGWGCTFVRYFWLLLVKIRGFIDCSGTYEPPFHVAARTARTKFAPLAPGLRENSHQFTPAGHLLAPIRYCRKCHSLQSGLRLLP